MIAIFAGLWFFGAMGLVAALGGEHDAHTTRKTVWALAAIAAGVFGTLVEIYKAVW